MEDPKAQCIFCQIIEGAISSRKVYEDDLCVGVLDINPANPGHVLLLPREHFAIMPQVPEEVIARMSVVAKQISLVMLKVLGVEGTNIFIANGMAAGQRAPHFIVHVIPRMKDDGVPLKLSEGKLDGLDEMKQKLAESIAKVMQ